MISDEISDHSPTAHLQKVESLSCLVLSRGFRFSLLPTGAALTVLTVCTKNFLYDAVNTVGAGSSTPLFFTSYYGLPVPNRGVPVLQYRLRVRVP